jgi:hypothetical protein
MRNIAQKRNSAGWQLLSTTTPLLNPIKIKHTGDWESQLTKLVIYCSFFNKKVQKNNYEWWGWCKHCSSWPCTGARNHVWLLLMRGESALHSHSHSLVLLHENRQNLENIQYVPHFKSLGTTTSLTTLNVICTYYTPPGESMREQSSSLM